jgi:nucleotide-binding universal stress UspA family protein
MGTRTVEFKHILCPVDFSDASKHAIDQAVAIAMWYESHITALHVLTPPPFVFEPPILLAERGGVSSLPVNRDQICNRLNEWMTPAVAARVPSATKIEEGAPADCILAHAESLSADLIVMGSHGLSGIERFVLGSVTEKVLRHAPCPVLTVPPRTSAAAQPPFARVLCPIDFSEPSIEALQVALSMAEEADARLVVMHVLDWHAGEMPLEPFDDPDVLSELQAQAARRLDSFITDEARVWSRPETKVAVGKAYREILASAVDMAADLIVIGVHGRNPIDLAVFGSTTNQVVRRATCPVLTIRSKA